MAFSKHLGNIQAVVSFAGKQAILGASFSGVFWFLQDMRHVASGGVGWLQFVVWSRRRYFGAFLQWRLRKKVFGRSVWK